MSIESAAVQNPTRDGELLAFSRRRIDALQPGAMQYAAFRNLYQCLRQSGAGHEPLQFARFWKEAATLHRAAYLALPIDEHDLCTSGGHLRGGAARGTCADHC
jgi:hypothetical protein